MYISACIFPALVYGLPVCLPRFEYTWDRLHRVHSLAVRLALRIHSRRVRTSALLRLIGWRSIKDTALLRALLFILRCVIFDRRFVCFLTCTLHPPRLQGLRGGARRDGQFVIANSGSSNVPLNVMLTTWNNCSTLLPMRCPKDVRSSLGFLSSNVTL